MERIIPTGRRILVLQEEAQETYGNSGIYIPETSQSKERKGTVVALGSEVTLVDEGSVIRYSNHADPIMMNHEGQPHLLMDEGAVLAIVVSV